jgi:carbon starvation protein
VVIACGAISGFHSLVSSGTSSKQCKTEGDSLYIGFGSMLLEGTLAALVIVAVAAGIGLGYTAKGGEIFTGAAAWQHHYADWGSIGGVGNYLRAVIQGSANMIQAIGIPAKITLAIMAVFVVSFAATTLDSATRIQRYVVVELSNAWNFKPLTGRQAATAFAVLSAALLAFYDGSGKGALKLWPLFGSLNQLLAGLALLVITIYLARRKINIAFTCIPMVFMIIMTGWAMIINIGRYYSSANWLLFVISLVVFLLEIWMIIESVLVLKTVFAKEEGLPETVT